MMEMIQELLSLVSEIKEIKAGLMLIRQTRVERFKESWIDGQDVLMALNISQRTLQSLRDNGTLRFSRINGKFYYKISDLEVLLENNYSGNPKNSDDNATK